MAAAVLCLVAIVTTESAAQADTISLHRARDLNAQATEVLWQTQSKRLKGKGAATS